MSAGVRGQILGRETRACVQNLTGMMTVISVLTMSYLVLMLVLWEMSDLMWNHSSICSKNTGFSLGMRFDSFVLAMRKYLGFLDSSFCMSSAENSQFHSCCNSLNKNCVYPATYVNKIFDDYSNFTPFLNTNKIVLLD